MDELCESSDDRVCPNELRLGEPSAIPLTRSASLSEDVRICDDEATRIDEGDVSEMCHSYVVQMGTSSETELDAAELVGPDCEYCCIKR